jgi:hypothetical protein
MLCHSAMETVTPSQKLILSNWFAHLHSFHRIKFIIFSGNSTGSTRVFNIQKLIIRIMADVKTGVSYTELFKKFNKHPLASEFYSCLLSATWRSFERILTYN